MAFSIAWNAKPESPSTCRLWLDSNVWKVTKYVLGTSIIFCNTDVVYPLEKDIYAFPLAGI